jgi:AraC-like DNA-binding protein
MWRGAVTACFWLSQTRHIASANLLGALPYTPVLEPPNEGAAKVFPTPVRQQIILRSDNLRSDDFGALFSRLFGNRYADNPPLPSNIIIGGVYGRHDGVSFRRMHYHGDFTVAFPDPQDEITFVIPTAGKIVFNHATESIGMSHVGLAIDKADIRSMQFLDDHAHHGMSINRLQLTERLSALLDKPILQKIVFQPSVDLNSAAFQGIKALIDLATGTEFDLLLNSGTLMPSRLREMLVDAVLEAWPHNFSEALRRPAPMVAPRHVKLAVEFIQAHPEQLVSGVDLARLSHVSQRALQEGFRRFVGMSIVAYQRQVRLERAYEVLRQRGSGSVTEVALRFGFSNVGRFCQYFQGAFGVSPAGLRGRD